MRFDAEILLHHRRNGGFAHGKSLVKCGLREWRIVTKNRVFTGKRPSEKQQMLFRRPFDSND
ncbi:hypothetical protein CRG49_009905 [Neisseria sp. N95_16]|nr:hypothetical protein CRG49_009905 [Neisseria sp. N95_16]PJO79083.1 hypothetical protein CWC45_01720 [Neisseria sp. N177_16]